MKITDILKNKKPSLSFEFFPPKNPDLENVLFETIESLKDENADFASVTFGAGGSSSDKTLEWTKKIGGICDMATMMHLTCVGFDKKRLDSILDSLIDEGVENVLALRGDAPKDGSAAACPCFPHASDLIEHIAGRGSFCIGAAGYPEGHPESASLDKDMQALKRKVECGAEFVITQLFFDNKSFFKYRDGLRKMGVSVPLIAGIMPVVSFSQIIRFVGVCGARIPDALTKAIEGRPDDEVAAIGADYAARQCEELVKEGADGLHFYTLNRSAATGEVLKKLKKRFGNLKLFF